GGPAGVAARAAVLSRALTRPVSRGREEHVTQIAEAGRRLAIEEAAAREIADPANARTAARLLAEEIADDAATHGVRSFSGSLAATHAGGLIQDRLAEFVAAHADELDAL